LLRRGRLLERLSRGLTLPFTLICAPAGFGKTVLALQWLESIPDPSAWLSIEQGDDVDTFVAGLVATSRTRFPDALPETSQLTASRSVVLRPEALRSSLRSELEDLPERMVLVIDDYQNVHADQIHDLVADLVERPLRQLHLVLIARVDPPLPLARLRARAQVSDIRARDLRLSREEIAEVVADELGNAAPPETVAAFENATEGWPAGVRLSLEAWRRHEHSGARVPSASLLDSSSARDFLASEVLRAQPPAVQRYLLASAVLNRFCAPLCEAMLAGDATPETATLSGQGFIDWLQRADLFVISLDDGGIWLRYDNVFRDMLERQLSQTSDSHHLRRLHHRASDWLSAHGLYDDAFTHAVEAGDPQAGTRLAAEHGRVLLEREEFQGLARWLAGLPPDLVSSSPELIVLDAWVAGESLSQLQRMGELLDRAEALIGDHPSETDSFTRGAVEALRSFSAYLTGDGLNAALRAERAAEVIPPRYSRCLAFAAVLEVTALQMARRTGEAIARARSMMPARRFQSTKYPPWTWGLAYVWWLEADMDQAYRAGRELARHGREFDLQDTIAHGEYFMGAAAYQRDQVAQALEHFAAAAEHPHLCQAITYVHATAGQALCHLADGDSAAAARAADSMAEFVMSGTSRHLQEVADAFMVEMALRQGHRAKAERWLRSEGSTGLLADLNGPPDSHSYMLYDPATTLVKALLAPATKEAREHADRLVLHSIAFAEQTNNRSLLVQVLGLQALTARAGGEDAAALTALERAVSLSQPGGALRLLADLGPALTESLNRLRVGGDELAHVAAILSAIGVSAGEPGETPSLQSLPASVVNPSGMDPLTPRERSVLALLARHYTNKEIAGDLLIAQETVKKHSINLYRKLNVGGRREAVAKARALGYFGGD